MIKETPMQMRIAVIATVLNEEPSIRGLLDSLCAQTRPPDEVIIVDGGSEDATTEIIESYADRLPIRLLHRSGANISEGRNTAIAAANSQVIASTDAGVRLVPDWIETLIEPFEGSQGEERPAVVSGFFLPDPHTPLEVALGATILPRAEDIQPEKFLPSSRSVAFLKAAWELWPYPEWLDYGEDLVFDLGLRELGSRFVFRPKALAWFRPRSSLAAFFKQYYRYARGDGKADLWRRRHAIRYGTYLLIFPSLLALGLSQSAWWLAILAGAGALYLLQPYRRLLPELAGLKSGDKVMALALVPVIRVVGDVAKMVGYPAGLWWRLRHRHMPGNDWRSELAQIKPRSGF